MIERIQEAMRAPMAAPPGRHSPVGRFAPEICAGLVYLVTMVVAVLARREEHPVLIGALVGYGVACLLMLIGPVGSAAQSLVFEYEGRTAEALVLTSMDHARLAVGRYWHAALPWLRFMVWLLPIYASHVVNGGVDAQDPEEFLGLSGLFAIGPKAYFIGLMGVGVVKDGMHPCWAGMLTAIRFCVDAIGVLLAAAIAFEISARMRRSWASAVVSYAMVMGAFGTVFMAVEWAAVLIGTLIALGAWLTRWSSPVEPSPEVLIALYFLAKALMVVFEAWTARWLVLRVARNFDYLMLGERPGSPRSRVTMVPGARPSVHR